MRYRTPPLPSTKTKVQQFDIPYFRRAAIKASCRVLVKNSDKVIPVPFKHVLACQILFFTSNSHNLIKIGLGLSEEEPFLKLIKNSRATPTLQPRNQSPITVRVTNDHIARLSIIREQA
ncbi:unnamed protein product [Parnassius mnemosyne]|uniref:Ribosomal protein S10 n=1 Tax=Parnassius mnemosyne TaxID=213953 RepID=A0AAV1L1M4_9NEOP